MTPKAPLEPEIQAVLQADNMRLSATAANDAAALEAVLDPDLTYTHNNGFREGRESYLDRIRQGQVRYISFERPEASVRVFGNVALVDGRSGMTYQRPSDEAPLTIDTLYLAAWIKTDGRWRLAAYASTLGRT